MYGERGGSYKKWVGGLLRSINNDSTTIVQNAIRACFVAAKAEDSNLVPGLFYANDMLTGQFTLDYIIGGKETWGRS